MRGLAEGNRKLVHRAVGAVVAKRLIRERPQTLKLATRIAAFVLLLVSGSFAQVQKWRTPGGALYFGDRPPAGSTLVGDTETLGTSGGGEVKPVPTRPIRTTEQRKAEKDAVEQSLKAWNGMRDALGGKPRPEQER
jgi:hypothetical protein